MTVTVSRSVVLPILARMVVLPGRTAMKSEEAPSATWSAGASGHAARIVRSLTAGVWMRGIRSEPLSIWRLMIVPTWTVSDRLPDGSPAVVVTTTV